MSGNGVRIGSSIGCSAPTGAPPPNVLVPFLLGTVVGGVAGAVAGTLLSEHTAHLAASVLDLIDRRLSDAERERLRFELLLQ